VSYFARKLGLDRTYRYRAATAQDERDQADIAELELAHTKRPIYGSRRLAVHLGWNRKKVQRLMRKAGIQLKLAKGKPWRVSGKSANPAPANQLSLDDSPTTKQAWVQDFTYLKFCGRWYYLAVIVELESRRVVGWALGGRHTASLILQALKQAMARYPAPAILHSDRGSEYLSTAHFLACEYYGIQISCSAPSSPWQNGYMESWFGKFKQELGPLAQYEDIGQLYEAIAGHIYFYNYERIHTVLGMSPEAHARKLAHTKSKPTEKRRTLRDRLLQILGP
jgi:transposase InsO family protein